MEVYRGGGFDGNGNILVFHPLTMIFKVVDGNNWIPVRISVLAIYVPTLTHAVGLYKVVERLSIIISVTGSFTLNVTENIKYHQPSSP